MRILPKRYLGAFLTHLVIHLVVFELASWAVVYTFLGPDLLLVLVSGFLSALVVIFIELILGPRAVSSILKPRWIGRGDDAVLWSLVNCTAEKAGVKMGKIGILDLEAPEALATSSIIGRTTVFLTKGLLIKLTYAEVRAVVTYLMGCSKSGALGFVTALSGLLVLSNKIASGYIESRLEQKSVSLLNIVLAGWGYAVFALVYLPIAMAARNMSIYGCEFSVSETGDPPSYLSALIKVAAGLVAKPSDPIRTACTPLKGLVFQDPASSFVGSSAIKEAAEKLGIDLKRLLGYEPPELAVGDEPRLHVFERFWVQPALSERLEYAMKIGEGTRSPIYVGLNRAGVTRS
jgi:hypothetical protein